MGLIGSIKKLFSQELNETLEIKYKSKYTQKKNPKLTCRRVYENKDNVNQDGLVLTNGNRRLYVRTFDDKFSDRTVKKTGINKDYKGNYILNVKNSDTKDYTKLTGIIDKALKLK